MVRSGGVAPLSYTSTYGYYGLRENPSFEQVVGTVRKPLRVPLPDRHSKWYALSPYRAFILDAEQKFSDHQHASVDYRQSGAELPETAAAVRPSDAGDDPAWERMHMHGERLDEHDAYEMAFEAMNAEHQRETAETRREQLRLSHGSNRMHPVVEAIHDELVEAGVPHYTAAPREPPPRRGWHTSHEQFVAAGQPQAPSFPSFEQLNMGQPANVQASVLTPSQNMTYERAREFVVQPTWSS